MRGFGSGRGGPLRRFRPDRRLRGDRRRRSHRRRFARRRLHGLRTRRRRARLRSWLGQDRYRHRAAGCRATAELRGNPCASRRDFQLGANACAGPRDRSRRATEREEAAEHDAEQQPSAQPAPGCCGARPADCWRRQAHAQRDERVAHPARDIAREPHRRRRQAVSGHAERVAHPAWDIARKAHGRGSQAVSERGEREAHPARGTARPSSRPRRQAIPQHGASVAHHAGDRGHGNGFELVVSTH
jgi:hypothetical protein